MTAPGGPSDGGFTLIELMIVTAILAALAGLVVPSYLSAVETARRVKAIAEIKAIQTDLEMFRMQTGELPLTLAAAGLGQETDPWGRPYEYLNFETIHGNGKKRKDKNLVPINSEYDLYSLGPDGKSQTQIHVPVSRDDIIRADDGSFIDVASKY